VRVEEGKVGAAVLVDALAHLPLALAQACAVITRLHPNLPHASPIGDHPVLRTWSTAGVEQVRVRDIPADLAGTLLTTFNEDGMILMHRVVQRVIRDPMTAASTPSATAGPRLE
jgi:hypothetical protein